MEHTKVILDTDKFQRILRSQTLDKIFRNIDKFFKFFDNLTNNFNKFKTIKRCYPNHNITKLKTLSRYVRKDLLIYGESIQNYAQESLDRNIYKATVASYRMNVVLEGCCWRNTEKSTAEIKSDSGTT